MLTEMLTRHVVTLFIILLFSIKLWTKKSFLNTENKYFWLTVLCTLVLVIEDVLERIAAEDPSMWFFRTTLSIIGYTLRSVAALGLLLVIMPRKKTNALLWIPSMITFLSCCTAYFTDIAFGYDEEYAFHRGPLGYIAFVVPIFYILMILIIAFRQFSYRSGVEKFIPPICGVFCMCAAAADVYAGGTRLNEAIVMCSVFFYVVLYSRDNRLDPLTGLFNRQALYDDCAARGKNVGAVASLDMNGLKALNDSKGHYAGDEALRKIGECLRAAADRGATAYRIGGDEFLILFFHGDESEITETENRVCASVEEAGYSISCGHAVREEGQSIAELIGISDRLMYEHKAEHYRAKNADRRKN